MPLEETKTTNHTDTEQADWCEENKATVAPADHFGLLWEVQTPVSHPISWFGATRREAIDKAMDDER